MGETQSNNNSDNSLQFVPEQRVAVLRGRQILKRRLWWMRSLSPSRLAPTLYLILPRFLRRLLRPVVVLPVQLPAVKVGQEFLQLARRVNILEVIKQVHVPERIDRDEWQVRLRLAQMMQGMCKRLSVGR